MDTKVWISLPQRSTIPNSFAHLPLGPAYTTNQYDKYNNILYPLEPALIESFVEAELDDGKEHSITSWGDSLRPWIYKVIGSLNITNVVPFTRSRT